jgi:hypothetical protein
MPRLRPPARADGKKESEQQLALDQWLRWIPDDPAGLLRRKFMIEHMLKQQRETSRERASTLASRFAACVARAATASRRPSGATLDTNDRWARRDVQLRLERRSERAATRISRRCARISTCLDEQQKTIQITNGSVATFVALSDRDARAETRRPVDDARDRLVRRVEFRALDSDRYAAGLRRGTARRRRPPAKPRKSSSRPASTRRILTCSKACTSRCVSIWRSRSIKAGMDFPPSNDALDRTDPNRHPS